MRFLRASHHDCHHSDFEEEIRPAGLPRKRYPFLKPRAQHRGQSIQHGAKSGHGGTKGQGRGTRGGPGGARQVGRAPHTFDFQ